MKTTTEKKRAGRPRRADKPRTLCVALGAQPARLLERLARKKGRSKREIIEAALLSYAGGERVEVQAQPLTAQAKLAEIRKILDADSVDD